MPRLSFVLAVSLFAVAGLVACTATAVEPSRSPSVPPASPSASPTPPPSASPPPSFSAPPATPVPSDPPIVATPRPETPRPTAPGFSEVEQYLLDGVQRGTVNCQPAGGSDDLPKDALGGIECDSTEPAVARIGFYLFSNDQDMVDAYLFRMNAEGVELESGTCFEGEAEHAYYPGEGFVPERAGCFLNDEGFANYRYTMPGEHIYVGILGSSGDMVALERFAWVGNADTPGIPTLWFGGID